MLQIKFLLNEPRVSPPGFDLGILEIKGDMGEAASKAFAPMMVILSIVELLDGSRRFLSNSRTREYRFIGVDSSFCISFRRSMGNIITYVDGHNLHVCTPTDLKRDIEKSILQFMNDNEISGISSDAEANDLRAAIHAYSKALVE